MTDLPQDRLGRAAKVLDHYRADHGGELEDSLVDLIADLMLYADKLGLNGRVAASAALSHYLAENGP